MTDTLYTGSRGELNFEDDFISALKKAGWETEVLKNKTTDDLVQNWRRIIFERNRVKLNDVPLSDNEMNQIMDRVHQEADTPCKANLFLRSGDRGIPVMRDKDSMDSIHAGKEVYVNVFSPAEIAGGTSRYQIAEQVVFPGNAKRKDRRADIILLIDGIPVIEIELKASGHSVTEAEDQIRKYMQEGVYIGILSLVQVFFCITPDEAVYFANPGDYLKLNPVYIFHWADADNQRIDKWRDLILGANHILSIPEAHRMISYYTVADKDADVLKVCRSYQYNAVHAILKAVKDHVWGDHDQKGGYIWNTTGSGKTLSSFLAGEMIHDMNLADKVVFVVDRKALDSQSRDEYNSFSRSGEEVAKTVNTWTLFQKLKSDEADDALIMTSIQKLSRIASSEKIPETDKQAAAAKRIVFIVDEAQRSQFGEMHKAVKNLFYNALFFGFTGTPIMNENKRPGEQTTDGVFGKCLAVYTLANGIRDGNVLGFWPDYVHTFDDNEIRRKVALSDAKVTDGKTPAYGTKQYEVYRKITSLPMAGYTGSDDDGNDVYVKGIEDYLTDADYNTDAHREAVVEDIAKKFDTTSRGEQGTKFSALLAVGSIPEAYAYWKLIRKEHPEWNIAATFDPHADANTKNTGNKEQWLTEIAEQYYQQFTGRHFDRKADPDFSIYKEELIDRLSHKDSFKNLPDDQVVDICIVVNQLLIGFDSKYVNCLYLDQCLESDNLIQAISRTNRTLDLVEKPAGIVRFYKKPATMQKKLDEALKLYCQGDVAVVQTADLETNLQNMNDVFHHIETVFSHDDEYTKNFNCLPSSDADRDEFRKSFITLRSLLRTVMLQGFHWSDADSAGKLDFTKEQYDLLFRRYLDLSAKRTKSSDRTGRPAYDFSKHLSDYEGTRIDSDYLEQRFGILTISMLNHDTDQVSAAADEMRQHLGMVPEAMQPYAEKVLDDAVSGILEPEKDVKFSDYIQRYRESYIQKNIADTAAKYGVDEDLLYKVYKDWSGEDIRSSKELEDLENTSSSDSFSFHRKLYKDLAEYILSGGAELVKTRK